jgi:hypothetical protein
MYVTIGTLQKKVKNMTLTVREFYKRIVHNIDSTNALCYHPNSVVSIVSRHHPPLQPPLGKRSRRRHTIEDTPTDAYKNQHTASIYKKFCCCIRDSTSLTSLQDILFTFWDLYLVN